MAAEVAFAFDVVEEILIRLDVKDIIRCKSVCKSWQSFLSTPAFVNAHMNHAYNNDVHRRRIGCDWLPFNTDSSFSQNAVFSVGSCNGLVCVSPRDVELVVTNPCTRESKKLPTFHCRPAERVKFIRQVVCCLGFGYDASTDDYKVIVGFGKRIVEERTLFHVLTLKSNAWKVIGEVKYKSFQNKSGILCGGALHWFMSAAKKKVIMSLDLSTEECKEIPQPAEAEYELANNYDYSLGVIEECLCVYSSLYPLSSKIWVMKNNKWEPYNNSENESKNDVAHCMIRVKPQNRTSNYVYDLDVAHWMICVDPQVRTRYVYTLDDGRLVPSVGPHIHYSLFVKSLVSPHQTKWQLEGNDAKGNIRMGKSKRKRLRNA